MASTILSVLNELSISKFYSKKIWNYRKFEAQQCFSAVVEGAPNETMTFGRLC